MKIKKWLLTSPIDEACYFTNIRKLARAIHLCRGHRWAEHMASCDIVGKVVEVKFRKCIDCDVEEMTDEKGEWVKRTKVWHNNLYMEDVSTIAIAAFKEIEDGLKKFGITLTPEQEDEFFVPILDKLERYSNGDYRSQN